MKLPLEPTLASGGGMKTGPLSLALILVAFAAPNPANAITIADNDDLRLVRHMYGLHLQWLVHCLCAACCHVERPRDRHRF
jgi:hypothetical protein